MDLVTREIKPRDYDKRKIIQGPVENFNKANLRSLYIVYKDITRDQYKN